MQSCYRRHNVYRKSMNHYLIAWHFMSYLSSVSWKLYEWFSCMKYQACYYAEIREWVTEKYFSYFSTKTYVVGTQKNCLNETKAKTCGLAPGTGGQAITYCFICL